MNYFYIIINKQKDKDYVITKQIRDFLVAKGKECYIQSVSDGELDGPSYTNQKEIPSEVDCVIVLGGDGTLLQATSDMIDRDIPFLGVNLGTLGYLAEVDKDNLEEALSKLINDFYEIEERMMLQGNISRSNSSDKGMHALNEIVIARKGSLQIVDFDVFVNGQFLKNYSADGIIISTPTGSTGYNMSAGGPIVEPKAKLLVITPICPHTLNTRSIVLGEDDRVVVEVREGRDGKQQEVEAIFDGSHMVPMKTGEKIEIFKSPKVTKIIKINKVSFLEMLHQKMREI